MEDKEYTAKVRVTRMNNPNKEGGKEYTAKESVTVKGTWSEDRIYCPYPTTDGEKNPNLKR